MSSRILHVVESLDHGAVENWLVRMLRHARKNKMDADWTFYCVLGRPGVMDDEVRKLGAHIFYSTAPFSRGRAFMHAFRSVVRSGGYDVLHFHHDLVRAVYLLAVLGIPLRHRIVHVHNADENLPTPSRAKQLL